MGAMAQDLTCEKRVLANSGSPVYECESLSLQEVEDPEDDEDLEDMLEDDDSE
jgi:hypothetical protein